MSRWVLNGINFMGNGYLVQSLEAYGDRLHGNGEKGTFYID